MSLLDKIKMITLAPALIVAVILILIAMLLFRRGLVPTLLWAAAIALVVLGAYHSMVARVGG